MKRRTPSSRTWNDKSPVSIINNKYKTYLIGSMESPGTKDCGVGWRQSVTPHFNRRGIYCFDPTKEESKKVGMNTSELLQKLNGWQLSERWDLFRDTMRKVWLGVSTLEEDPNGAEPRIFHLMGDVDYVENSDFLVWYLHDGDNLGGTIAELTIAWYRGIPAYLVSDIPKTRINKSLLYFVLDSGHGRGKLFDTFTDFYKFLDDEYQ